MSKEKKQMAPGLPAAEIEAKLLAEEADLISLADCTQLGPYPLKARRLQSLSSTYFDTPDFALTRRAIALRLRQRDGKHWEATLKWAGTVRGLVHARPELNVALSSPPGRSWRPPPGLWPYLAALCAGQRLVPILVTTIERLPIDVYDPTAARVLAEIAVDRVALSSPSRRVRHRDEYAEVEIELKKGSEADLGSIVRHLRQRWSLRASRESKLERGLHLLYADEVIRSTPPPPVDRDDAAAAVRALLGVEAERLIEADPGARLGHEAEPIHVLRTTLRRLRVIARVFAPALPETQAKHLRRELDWLGGKLGSVRDLDIALQQFAAHGDSLSRPRRRQIAPFEEHLRALRAAARHGLIEAMDSPRYARLLRRLASPPVLSEGVFPTRALVAAELSRRYRKLRKLHKASAGKSLDLAPEALHRLRLQVRRARYTTELLAPWLDRSAKKVVRQLRELQDCLGAHHDAYVVTGHIQSYLAQARPSAGERNALAALARILEADAERARNTFARSWRKLGQGHIKATGRKLLESLERGAPRRRG